MTTPVPQISRSLIAIYPSGPDFSSTALLLRLFPKVQAIFSGEQMVLPNVDGIPPEVPRITFKSKDQNATFEFSLQRINLVLHEGNEFGLATIESIQGWATKILALTLQVMPMKIGRLAWVIDRYVESSSPALELSKHFCKDQFTNASSGALKRPENFELHSHKKFLLAPDLQVNSWIRCKTGSVVKGKDSSKVIGVQQDMNTLAEDLGTKSFSLDQIQDFLKAAGKEFDTIYNLYFPQI